MYNRYDNDLHPRETVLDSLSSIIDHNDSLQDHIKFLSSVSMFSRASKPWKNKRNLTSTRDHQTKLGTLSNDNDDGSENVAKKMNLRSFKLNRVYLDPLNISNAGDFSWSWLLKDFIQVQKQGGKFVVVCPRSP